MERIRPLVVRASLDERSKLLPGDPEQGKRIAVHRITSLAFHIACARELTGDNGE
jgi:hypothetical protein